MHAVPILFWLAIYGLGAIVLTLLLRGRNETASHFLHTNRELPLWVLSLSFLAANCSALEVLTIIATSAKYGLYAVNFYWLGAIPALVFLICVMLPIYERTGVRTVPEYFEQRFNRATRATGATLFCLMMIAIAGLTICIFSRLAHLTLGCGYSVAIWAIAILLSLFLASGGLTAVIYSEAIQFLLFFLVLIPLTFRLLHQFGGLTSLLSRLPSSSQHSLTGMSAFAPHAEKDGVGLIVGLGFVLGFSYWCGDLLLLQRLLAARTRSDMARTPATALIAKLALPFVLVVPGLAFSVLYRVGAGETYDMALPRLLAANFSQGVFAMATAALFASLFLGMAGNLAAAVTIFAHDLYQPFLKPGASELHYARVGRLAAILMPLLAAGAAYLAFASNSLMEYVQLVLGVLNVPLAVVMLMGMLITGISRRSGVPAILAGAVVGVVHALIAPRLHYGSGLATAFYGAIFAAAATAGTAMLLSWPWLSSDSAPSRWAGSVRRSAKVDHGLLLLCIASLSLCCLLYWRFR